MSGKTLTGRIPTAITKRRDYRLLLLALPFLLIVLLFNYVPLFGWIYAFFDYKPGIPLRATPFVGLKYFRLILSDWPDMQRVLINTLAMSFLGLAISPLPMVLAVLLNEVRSLRYKKLVQTATTIPNFVSWVIVFSMAFAIFSYDGLLNNILSNYIKNQKPYSVLASPGAVWFFQTALGIWKSLGWNAIIYLAAISGIDGELYDAAKVDGASRFQLIMNVTVPGMLSTFVVLLTLNVSNMISVGFDQFFIFKNPIVADKIEVLDVYIYRLGIANNDFAYATAVGLFKTVVSVILLFAANCVAKKIRGSSIF